MGQLQGKVAVITGAASGMGAAAARLFSHEGAHVVLADLNGPGGEAVAQAASEAGQRCVFQRTDVSAEADIQALVARALSEFGRLDVMFNNAGIGGAIGPLEGVSVEDWDRTQAVCLCAASSSASSIRSGRCARRAAAPSSRPPRSPASTASPACTPTARPRPGW